MDESAKDVFARIEVPESDYMSTDGMGAGSPEDGPVSSEDVARVVAEYEVV